MTIKSRTNEIFNQITAFSKDTYTKEEYLPELMKLQEEVVNLTFNGELPLSRNSIVIIGTRMKKSAQWLQLLKMRSVRNRSKCLLIWKNLR